MTYEKKLTQPDQCVRVDLKKKKEKLVIIGKNNENQNSGAHAFGNQWNAGLYRPIVSY